MPHGAAIWQSLTSVAGLAAGVEMTWISFSCLANIQEWELSKLKSQWFLNYMVSILG